MTYCEDAPCCGCCGTDLYGNNESRGYDEPGEYDDYDDRDEDETDPADCDHGDYSWSEREGIAQCDLCFTDGVCFAIMGEFVVRFPVTKVTYDLGGYEGGEDRHLDGSYES